MLFTAVESTGATLVRGKWVVVVKIRTPDSRPYPVVVEEEGEEEEG